MSSNFRHLETFFLHTVCGVHIWVSTAGSQRCGQDNGRRGRSDGLLQSRQEHDVVLASLPLFLDYDELLNVVVLCQLFCRFSFVVLDINICTSTNEHRYYRCMTLDRCIYESGISILSYKKKNKQIHINHQTHKFTYLHLYNYILIYTNLLYMHINTHTNIKYILYHLSL